MQLQLGELQNKLQTVEAEKNKLKDQLTSSKDALATIDQLKDVSWFRLHLYEVYEWLKIQCVLLLLMRFDWLQEQSRLSSNLAAEQAKALEQANQLTKLKSLLEESESVVSKEKASSQQLREEIEKMKVKIFVTSLCQLC